MVIRYVLLVLLLLRLLQADMAILDEIDSGLDIDALRDVAAAVNGLNTPERSVLMVTHYRVRPRHSSSSSSVWSFCGSFLKVSCSSCCAFRLIEGRFFRAFPHIF
jgi:hypothetical protein